MKYINGIKLKANKAGLVKRVGLTTTVPVEIIFASGKIPIDVNNIFVSADRPADFIDRAEQIGYPRTSCSWIKGLYGSIMDAGIEEVIAIMVGDCSYTHSLMETLKLRGIETYPFAYPYDRDEKALAHEMKKLMKHFQVTWDQVYEVKADLDHIRQKLVELDILTWQEGLVRGFENHLWQVSASDFNSDYHQFEENLDKFLVEIRGRQPFEQKLRLGYIGVPPIIPEIYDYLESKGAYVVFNEVQRQFTMPFFLDDLVKQYSTYSYPYDVRYRLQDIQREIEKRQLDGIIHYTQSFCHRQIDDIVFKEYIDVPILTLEADRPGGIDGRTKMRLDAFVDMLGDKVNNLSSKKQINLEAMIEDISGYGQTDDTCDETVSKSGRSYDTYDEAGLVCGIDLGSRNVKIAILDRKHDNKILELKTFSTIDFYSNYGYSQNGIFQIDFAKLGLGNIQSVASTGYGRNTIQLAGARQIAELEAHLLGALYQLDLDDFTLLDLGGQDSKVIKVREGKMVDFITNDKCAASSGRYLENMAVIIGVSLDELSLHYENPVELNATCAVFGESELIGKIAEGYSKAELAAGINYTIVKRIEPLLRKLDSDCLVFTGGVAYNQAIVEQLKAVTEKDLIVPKYPEYNGAIGAAISNIK